MRRQQETLNDTHKLEDERERGEKTPEEYRKDLDGLKKRQDDLEQELKKFGKDLSDKGLKSGDGLKDAENKMNKSGQALQQGDAGGSADQQSQALDAMRNGAGELMQEMQQAMKKNGEKDENGDAAAKDPLGRKLGSAGHQSEKNAIPQESDMQRARRILDEIRKKLGQSALPENEKDYLERLLKFD